MVKPCAADVQARVQTQLPAISNFRSVTLSQNLCNGHMMQAELTPPPPTGGPPPYWGSRGGVWVGGWVGQLGWVGGLANPEAAPK